MSEPEDMERPAKRWEIKAVTTEQAVQGKQLETINLKLDRLLESQVTSQHVDDKIKIVDDKLENAVKAVHNKYDPVLDNVKWLTRALIVAIFGVLANIVVQLWST